DMMTLIVLRGIMAVGMGAEIIADFGSFPEYLPTATRGKYSSISAMIGNFSPPVASLVAFILIPVFSWRAMFLVVGVATLLLWYVRLKTLPESPRWLASQGLIDQADEALTKLEKQLAAEKGVVLPPIEHVEAPPKVKQVPLTALFKGQLLRRTIAISCGLIGLNTALYTIVNWIPTIFVNAGVTVSRSFAMTTLMLCGAPLGVYLISLIADNLPRRSFAPLLLAGIGIFGYIYSLQRDPVMIVGFGFLMTVIIYMYVGLMNAVYVPEMFPTEARLRGTGFCSALGRLVSVFTPPAVAWILTNYGAVTVFQTVLVVLGLLATGLAFFGIETRRKSLEEINKNVI
ncbi:MAG TPA: MFS transporter, partial [Negativicutes bacterium]|nr:MFS transporter [Negativicutes bacterium]